MSRSSLAKAYQLRYNQRMTQWTRLRPWLGLLLVAVVVIAAASWIQSTLPGVSVSPVPFPQGSIASPLATPPSGTVDELPLPAWSRVGATLMWMAVGAVLALGVSFVILRGPRHDA